MSISLSNMSFLSPDGRCYSFDERGNGYARGEGVVSLLLKPLSRAIQDGNPLRALVRAVGTNQDGYTSGGLTQPSMKMQAALIKETYRKAGLSMAETRFFEAHGMFFLGNRVRIQLSNTRDRDGDSSRRSYRGSRNWRKLPALSFL